MTGMVTTTYPRPIPASVRSFVAKAQAGAVPPYNRQYAYPLRTERMIGGDLILAFD